MASLTSQTQADDNRSDLAQAVEETKIALDLMTERITKLADFEIDTQFDFEPHELGRNFKDQAETMADDAPVNFNSAKGESFASVDSRDFIAYATTGSKGQFTPFNKVVALDIPVVDTDEIPDPEEASIDTDVPTAPDLAPVTKVIVSTGTKPGTGPEITDPEVVDAPTDDLRNAPELKPIIIPELYDPNIPFFEAEVPVVPGSFAAPPNTFNFDGGSVDYSDTELVQLQTVLLDDLQNGGYGVFHTDEEAIFAREVDRETAVAQASEEEMFDSFAAKGFPIPTGVQIDMLAKLQQQTLNKISAINREVAIQRAGLVREGRSLAFSTTTGLTGPLSTYRGFAYERLLKAQQFTATYAIQVFEASIQIFNLQIELFNAHANEFRMKMEGEIAQLERNKVVLDKARAQQDINDAEIALYSAEAQVLAIEANIYNTKVQAAKTKADIQVIKLERYKLEFQIYTAELTAESTKVANYVAQVGANEADLKLFAIETSAFGTKLEAQKVQESIYLARFDADVKRKELEFVEYEAKITLLNTELKQEADSITFQIEKYTADSLASDTYRKTIQTSLDLLAKEQDFVSMEAQRDLSWLAKNEEMKQEALDKKTQLEIQLLQERVSSITGIMTALSASVSHTDIVVSQ